MRIAITGAAGLFGHALVAAFSSRHTVFPLTRADADITDAESVRAVLGRIRPEVVVHPAGIPDLDIADADPARAHLVNVQGTRHVVESARAVRAGVVYISTDAVFNGQNTRPYVESDRPCADHGLRTDQAGWRNHRPNPAGALDLPGPRTVWTGEDEFRRKRLAQDRSRRTVRRGG